MLRIALDLTTKPMQETKLGKYSPLQLFIFLSAVYLLMRYARRDPIRINSKEIKKNLIQHAIKFGLFVPGVRGVIEGKLAELKHTIRDIKIQSDKVRNQFPRIPKLPDKGLPLEEVLSHFDVLNDHYKHGRSSGAVYSQRDTALQEMLTKIYSKTALTNPLHDHWPLIKKMYAEIIAWMQEMLGGSASGHGIITHGGSTSILHACFSFVRAKRRQGIITPEIILPESAHPAFKKSAEYLGAKVVEIPLDADGKADVAAMRAAITRHTCMLVGSAPSYSSGVIDPIAEIAALAQEYGLPCNVDGCLGGVQFALAKQAGYPDIPACGFAIPGVTSITIDTHKYFEADKGSSVVVYNPNSSYTPTQSYLDSMCGMYVTATVNGSDSGARIATLWATLLANGKEYYITSVKNILSLQRELVTELEMIPGLDIPFNPKLSVISFRAKNGFQFNPLIVEEKMKELGWSTNIIKFPDGTYGFHFCLTAVHTKTAHFKVDFINDMRTAVEYAKANPQRQPKGEAKAYGKIAAGIPDYLLQELGEAYIRIQNTIPGVDIPGVWEEPKQECRHSLRR